MCARDSQDCKDRLNLAATDCDRQTPRQVTSVWPTLQVSWISHHSARVNANTFFFRNAAQSLLWNLRQVFFALVPGVPKWEAAAWVRKREDTRGRVLAVAGHTLETAYAPNTAHGNYVHDSARLFVGLLLVYCFYICLL